MSALVIVSFNVLDAEKLKAYSAVAGPSITRHGGAFIAKGKPSDMNGKSQYAMCAVIQFDDKDAAMKWYNSAEYQQIIPTRDEAMESNFQLLG